MGNATDSAANMQGVYKGFSAWFQKEDVLHVWCYAHILNLYLSDVTNTILTTYDLCSLFGLLNEIALFF